MSINNILSKIYFDVRNPGGYGGVRNLYLEAKKELPNISVADVKTWVKNQLTYTLHKQVRNRFRRNKIIVQRKNEQFEADLVDMQMFSKYNNGFKYIITVIDCFSKYLYAYPLKSKNANEIINVFKKIFQTEIPEKLRTDRGLEFNNVKVKKFLKENNVHFFTSKDIKIKCAIVERVNRTLKSKMFRYFTRNNTRRYVDQLQNLVYSYNNSFHRTIKMRPIDVSDQNREEVFENIYKAKNYKEIFDKNNRKRHDLNVNDNVRIKYDLKENMDKSYYPLWSDRTYKIDKIIEKPFKPNFKVSSEGNPSNRSYYPEEIQKIGDDLVYRIENVLKKKKDNNGKQLLLVKYIGYSNEYNQWIPKENVVSKSGGSTDTPHKQQRN